MNSLTIFRISYVQVNGENCNMTDPLASLPGPSTVGTVAINDEVNREKIKEASQCENQNVDDKITKLELDSSTYIRTKGGPQKMANFIFSVQAHSLVNDQDGNKIYILTCCTKTARFKIPLILSDTDSYAKITSKIRDTSLLNKQL